MKQKYRTETIQNYPIITDQTWRKISGPDLSYLSRKATQKGSKRFLAACLWVAIALTIFFLLTYLNR